MSYKAFDSSSGYNLTLTQRRWNLFSNVPPRIVQFPLWSTDTVHIYIYILFRFESIEISAKGDKYFFFYFSRQNLCHLEFVCLIDRNLEDRGPVRIESKRNNYSRFNFRCLPLPPSKSIRARVKNAQRDDVMGAIPPSGPGEPSKSVNSGVYRAVRFPRQSAIAVAVST